MCLVRPRSTRHRPARLRYKLQPSATGSCLLAGSTLGDSASNEYRARGYHPGLGRFTSEDPKLFEAGDYNLFRYVHNDPIDLTDPMGLDSGRDAIIDSWSYS